VALQRLYDKQIPFTTDAATLLAGEVRRHLALDDASPVFDLASRLSHRFGILIFPLKGASIASVCALLDRTAYLFIAADLGVDQLCTCARGLANLIAMASRSGRTSVALVTPLIATSQRRGPREYFATNFAYELLVPTRGLGIALRKVRGLLKVTNTAVGDVEMLYVARIFGVDFAAVARRCERAQLLPIGGAMAMERLMIGTFGGAEKRADALGLPPRPGAPIPSVPSGLVPGLARRLRDEVFSLADAAAGLGTSAEDLASLFERDLATSKSFWQ
jgi:hypothetical protein